MVRPVVGFEVSPRIPDHHEVESFGVTTSAGRQPSESSAQAIGVDHDQPDRLRAAGSVSVWRERAEHGSRICGRDRVGWVVGSSSRGRRRAPGGVPRAPVVEAVH
jgi:hypothetical protein